MARFHIAAAAAMAAALFTAFLLFQLSLTFFSPTSSFPPVLGGLEPTTTNDERLTDGEYLLGVGKADITG